MKVAEVSQALIEGSCTKRVLSFCRIGLSAAALEMPAIDRPAVGRVDLDLAALMRMDWKVGRVLAAAEAAAIASAVGHNRSLASVGVRTSEIDSSAAAKGSCRLPMAVAGCSQIRFADYLAEVTGSAREAETAAEGCQMGWQNP